MPNDAEAQPTPAAPDPARAIQPTPVAPAPIPQAPQPITKLQRALNAAAPVAMAWEGIRLTPYRDTAGVWTIGIGSTFIDGEPVTEHTPPITHEKARELLIEHMTQDAYVIFNAVDGSYGKPAITANMLGALIDLAYNVGSNAVRNSTIVHLLNQGMPDQARAHFLDWGYVRDPTTHKLVLSKGVLNRRRAEMSLWDRPE